MVLRGMIQFILILIGAYVLALIALFVFQRSLMYHTNAVLVPLAETQIPTAIERTTESEPGLHLTSWYLPPKGNMPVIVYFHGNAGTIADRDYKVAPWHAAGYGIWLTGYRGFGSNPGKPSEQGLYNDARAVFVALKEEGVGPDRIFVYGESLGTGVATQMAMELADAGTLLRGLVLEAPFTSMPAAAQEHHPYAPAKWLVRDRYDNLSKIAKIKTSLMIVHGDQDRVLPQHHGRSLFDAAKKPKIARWLPGAGHTNLCDFGACQYAQDFFDQLSNR